MKNRTLYKINAVKVAVHFVVGEKHQQRRGGC